jgi:hypothetical protein
MPPTKRDNTVGPKKKKKEKRPIGVGSKKGAKKKK